MAADRPEPRKLPRQARSRALYDAILTASAELLERDGPGFNLSEVAVRAGASAGSLYQYFPDRAGLIGALVDQQIALDRARLEQWRSQNSSVPVEQLAEALVDGLLQLYGERPRLLTNMVQLLNELDRQRDVAAIVADASALLAAKLHTRHTQSTLEACRDAADAALLAVLGIIRHTSATEPEKLKSHEFRERSLAVARAALASVPHVAR